MDHRRVKAGLLALVLVGAATFVANSGVMAQERVLRVRIGSDITGMDPARLFNIENQTMCNQIYNGLTKYDYGKTNQLLPDLAERWDLSPDGRVYTFHLRKGVQWHKGYGELTAEDVKFSYERVLDPNTASKYRGEFKLVEKIEALDRYTVRITLKQKYPGFLNKVAAYNQGFVISKNALQKLAERYATEPIGTGPFIFESWSPKNQVVLAANKEYFEGPPKVDKIIFKLIYEETTAEIALQKGEIDIFYALQNPEVIKRLEKAPGIRVYRETMNHTVNLVMNPNHPPLADPKVRRAVAHSLNLRALREVFFQGLKNPPNWVLSTNFAESATDLTEWEHDPQKAKELLKEAGYPNGFPVILTTLALQPYDKIAVVLTDDMRKVGIDAKVQVLERAAYGAARSAGTPLMVVTGVTGPPDPDQPLWHLLHSSSFPPGMNTAHYSAIDELLEAAQVELDRQKQLQLYRKIQEKIREDVPVIPLYNDVVFAAAGDHVKGFVPDPQVTMFLYPVGLEKK
jgi:peptide/nickel transport system substrate-binding protein